MRKIRIGSRESKLAVVQSELVMRAISAQDQAWALELITMKTSGDKMLDRPLDQIGGKGLFVKELDLALLDGRIDLAVHSLKDMPMEQDEQLPILAYSRRADPRDVLILPQGVDRMDETKPIGCSSARRALQLKKLYPQMRVESVRGNVQTRLGKLDDGQYAALVLAYAGINRLGLEARISRVFSVEEMLPAAGQGILAVQGRAGEALEEAVQAVDDADARDAALAERAFVRALDGGCNTPVAAYAVLESDRLQLTGLCEDPHVADGYRREQITGERKHAQRLGLTLAARMKRKSNGIIWLVGAGPGDVQLMTVKGQSVLQQAEVVVYDALIGAEMLALLPAHARRIDVGKRSGNHPVPQWKISEILLEEALKGKRVVRLKGGDPFLFGRGGEELELLAEYGIPFEVVPGVTSALAAPAYAGIPLTHRDFCSSVHIITGHRRAGAYTTIDYDALARLDGTLVFLMGVAALPEICAQLIKAGMKETTPATLVEQGTTARQRRIDGTLTTLPVLAQNARTPAVIVVGEVCALAYDLSWAEKRPLHGRRILVTRPRDRAGSLTDMLRARGAQVIELPSIETHPILTNAPLEEALAHINEYGWMVFTSPAGVEVFWEFLRNSRMDVRALGAIRLAAIGPATARELETRGIVCNLMPKEYAAAALGEALAQAAVGQKVLIVRAKEGSPELTSRLTMEKISFTDLAIYETVYAKQDARTMRKLLETGEIDWLTFTSASTVEGFVKTLGEGACCQGLCAVCIGVSTAKTAKKYGMRTAVAPEATIPAMVDTMMLLHAGGKNHE